MTNFKVGDTVELIDQTAYKGLWDGPMKVTRLYNEEPSIQAHHPLRGIGAFYSEKLQLFSPANKVKDAITLLQAEGYRTLAFVDKDSVQMSFGHSTVWINFDDFDAIAKVVEEAKEFKRKYRS